VMYTCIYVDLHQYLYFSLSLFFFLFFPIYLLAIYLSVYVYIYMANSFDGPKNRKLGPQNGSAC
jgi:hypothetical protein